MSSDVEQTFHLPPLDFGDVSLSYQISASSVGTQSIYSVLFLPPCKNSELAGREDQYTNQQFCKLHVRIENQIMFYLLQLAQKWLPKDTYVLIPRTCECAALHDIKDFAAAIKLRILRKREQPGLKCNHRLLKRGRQEDQREKEMC